MLMFKLTAMFNSLKSLHLYFASRSLANFSAPTVLLCKAAHKVCHDGLGSIFSHVLNISLRQCFELPGLSALIVFSVPSSSFSCSPRSYHWWEMSIRSSYAFFSSIGFWTASKRHIKLTLHYAIINTNIILVIGREQFL